MFFEAGRGGATEVVTLSLRRERPIGRPVTSFSVGPASRPFNPTQAESRPKGGKKIENKNLEKKREREGLKREDFCNAKENFNSQTRKKTFKVFVLAQQKYFVIV